MARILVVEDRAMNREFLVTLLGYYGHTLAEAADGNDALAAYARSARTSSSPTSPCPG
jgi:CheY-like chemotaxis protein